MTFTRQALLALPTLICAALLPSPAGAACKIDSVELPIYMSGLRPHVKAGINGVEVDFVLDSGAMYSMIAPAAAERLKLPHRRAPDNLRLYGVGGRADVRLTKVERFTLKGTTFDNVEFLVGGNLPGGGAIGLLGQNILGTTDVEYDFANGVMRLHRPNEDCKKARLAYWAQSQPVAEVELEPSRGPYLSRLTAYASVNGVKTQVLFDTGASLSILSLDAAKRAGLTPDGPGVVPGTAARGIGTREVKTWIGPLKSFALGEEQINDTRLRFGDLSVSVDMLLGADFFLSHRMYFAKSQGKVYFTYNGGPVFNLTPAASVARENPASAAEPKAAPADPPTPAQETPTSADGFARRAAAYAARKDYQRALADITRACEVEPGVSTHFTRRGQIHLALKQPSSALSDFNEAIRLNPKDMDARMARARLHFFSRNASAAREDLVAMDSMASPQSEVRFEMGRLYLLMHQPDAALVQLDQWIASHGQEMNLDEALSDRCWARALLGTDLGKALEDCNAAVKSKPTSARHDRRGLVHLRMGNLDRAIEDYDEALRLDPKNPWSLFGRGVVRVRKGEREAGRADIAAAKAIRASIEADAARYGLIP